MKINKLILKNFRNHLDKTIEFSDDINLILGANGAGKTNILEAIHLISTTKSTKAKFDRDIINYEQPFCTITLINPNDTLELQIIKGDTEDNTSSKKAKINKTPKSLSYFAGMFNSVLFTPQDVEMITGTPSLRRKYLDMVLIQTSKDYKKNLNLYIKAVRQRNKLLEMIRERRYGHTQIEYWDEQILVLGTLIQKDRLSFFENIKENIHKYNDQLNNNDTELKLNYKINEINRERMESHKETEIAAKTTLIGPHRDDFEIIYNNKDIAYFGSRGQQRTALLALKLAEIDFIELKTGEKPLLLLDDVFSELDAKHKNTVLTAIDGQQTIITATEKPDLKVNHIIEL